VLRVLEATAQRAGFSLSRGVLAQFHGPSYETPAEVRMAQQLGARIVGMSMVPEVVVGRQRGLRTAGIGAVTNFAADLQKGPLSHDEVLRQSAASAPTMQMLLGGAIPQLGRRSPAATRS
jgi:purine-nucleoside phosphorylase